VYYAFNNREYLPRRRMHLEEKMLKLIRLVKRELLQDFEEINAAEPETPRNEDEDIFGQLLKGSVESAKTESL
jgi:hypothetical protein